MIVEYVVPEGREGLINLMSAMQVRVSMAQNCITLIYLQILENWRNKRVIDPHIVGGIIATLKNRKAAPLPTDATEAPMQIDKNEIVKRIEEDRERHKRLRERRWVQPISHNPSANMLSQLATFMPETDVSKNGVEAELTIDIEFDNEWETTSDWNEDDDEAVAEENKLCFPNVLNTRPVDNKL
jgi:CTD kinase subunit gamma